jgi:diguanylate cyclase (GGDEF)-like protein
MRKAMTEKKRAPATIHIVEADTADEPTGSAERQLANYLRLGNLLHRSLDINEVVHLFASELTRELGLASVTYDHPRYNISMEFGEPALHRAEYALDIEGLSFGSLLMTCAKRLNKRDLGRLELAMGALMPALRNALQYLDAMQTAARDALTGVGNRIALEVTAEREIAMARRNGLPSALLVIDIDHFKRVNDKYGHSAGDCVLIETVRQLRQNCRESDSIFRFGGEEFVVLLSQTEENGAFAIAERIRNAIENMLTRVGTHLIHTTASIGVACLNRNEGLPAWFDRADRALYLAKRAGRNRVVRAAERNIA